MSPEFGLLRRLGVIAPLLGVTLTAGSVLLPGGGLQNLGADSSSGAGAVAVDGALLLAVVPLFSGVCAGALLAILNQVLVSLAFRREESLFIAATEPVRTSHFRDTEDRLDAIVAKMGEGGSRLTEASNTIGGMLGIARDAMQGMSDACNEAVTDLLALATRLESATEIPVREFVGAASELRRVSSDAAKEFGAGMKALSNRTAEIEKKIGDSIQKHVAAAEIQSQLVQSLVERAAQAEAALKPLNMETVQQFDSSLQAMASSMRSIATGMSELDKRFESASSGLEGANRALAAQFARLFEEHSQSIRRSTDEAEAMHKRSAAQNEVMAQQSVATTEASKIATQALSELVQLAQRLTQQVGATNGALRQRASEASELDTQISGSLRRVIASLRELGSRTSEVDPSHSARRIASLGASIDLIEGRLRILGEAAQHVRSDAPASSAGSYSPSGNSAASTVERDRIATDHSNPGSGQ